MNSWVILFLKKLSMVLKKKLQSSKQGSSIQELSVVLNIALHVAPCAVQGPYFISTGLTSETGSSRCG